MGVAVRRHWRQEWSSLVPQICKNSSENITVMGSIVLKTLSILLGLFFLFVGTMKLTPRLSKEMHKDMRKAFVQYSKIFPFSSTFGFKVPSRLYRQSVGVAEVICGFLLLLIPGWPKQVANVILLIMMLAAAYTHHSIGDKFERIAPALVFVFMLSCRLVIYFQVRRRANAPTPEEDASVTPVERQKQE